MANSNYFHVLLNEDGELDYKNQQSFEARIKEEGDRYEENGEVIECELTYRQCDGKLCCCKCNDPRSQNDLGCIIKRYIVVRHQKIIRGGFRTRKSRRRNPNPHFNMKRVVSLVNCKCKYLLSKAKNLNNRVKKENCNELLKCKDECKNENELRSNVIQKTDFNLGLNFEKKSLNVIDKIGSRRYNRRKTVSGGSRASDTKKQVSATDICFDEGNYQEQVLKAKLWLTGEDSQYYGNCVHKAVDRFLRSKSGNTFEMALEHKFWIRIGLEVNDRRNHMSYKQIKDCKALETIDQMMLKNVCKQSFFFYSDDSDKYDRRKGRRQFYKGKLKHVMPDCNRSLIQTYYHGPMSPMRNYDYCEELQTKLQALEKEAMNSIRIWQYYAWFKRNDVKFGLCVLNVLNFFIKQNLYVSEILDKEVWVRYSTKEPNYPRNHISLSYIDDKFYWENVEVKTMRDILFDDNVYYSGDDDMTYEDMIRYYLQYPEGVFERRQRAINILYERLCNYVLVKREFGSVWRIVKSNRRRMGYCMLKAICETMETSETIYHFMEQPVYVRLSSDPLSYRNHISTRRFFDRRENETIMLTNMWSALGMRGVYFNTSDDESITDFGSDISDEIEFINAVHHENDNNKEMKWHHLTEGAEQKWRKTRQFVSDYKYSLDYARGYVFGSLSNKVVQYVLFKLRSFCLNEVFNLFGVVGVRSIIGFTLISMGFGQALEGDCMVLLSTILAPHSLHRMKFVTMIMYYSIRAVSVVILYSSRFDIWYKLECMINDFFSFVGIKYSFDAARKHRTRSERRDTVMKVITSIGAFVNNNGLLIVMGGGYLAQHLYRKMMKEEELDKVNVHKQAITRQSDFSRWMNKVNVDMFKTGMLGMLALVYPMFWCFRGEKGTRLIFHIENMVKKIDNIQNFTDLVKNMTSIEDKMHENYYEESNRLMQEIELDISHYVEEELEELNRSINKQDLVVGQTAIREEPIIAKKIVTIRKNSLKQDVCEMMNNKVMAPICIIGATGVGKTTVVVAEIYNWFVSKEGSCEPFHVVGPRVATCKSAYEYLSKLYPSLNISYRAGGEGQGDAKGICYWTYGAYLMRYFHDERFRQTKHILYIDEAHESSAEIYVIKKLAANKLKDTHHIFFTSATIIGYTAEQSDTKYKIREKYVRDMSVNTIIKSDPNDDFVFSYRNLQNVSLFFCASKNQCNELARYYKREEFSCQVYTFTSETVKKEVDRFIKAYTNNPDVIYILVATNCLETGITLPVDSVYDFCDQIVSKLDIKKRKITLEKETTTKLNTIQRRGRAGRIKPGNYYYSRETQEKNVALSDGELFKAVMWSNLLELHMTSQLLEIYTDLGMARTYRSKLVVCLASKLSPHYMWFMTDIDGKVYRNFEKFRRLMDVKEEYWIVSENSLTRDMISNWQRYDIPFNEGDVKITVSMDLPFLDASVPVMHTIQIFNIMDRWVVNGNELELVDDDYVPIVELYDVDQLYLKPSSGLTFTTSNENFGGRVEGFFGEGYEGTTIEAWKTKKNKGKAKATYYKTRVDNVEDADDNINFSNMGSGSSEVRRNIKVESNTTQGTRLRQKMYNEYVMDQNKFNRNTVSVNGMANRLKDRPMSLYQAGMSDPIILNQVKDHGTKGQPIKEFLNSEKGEEAVFHVNVANYEVRYENRMGDLYKTIDRMRVDIGVKGLPFDEIKATLRSGIITPTATDLRVDFVSVLCICYRIACSMMNLDYAPGYVDNDLLMLLQVLFGLLHSFELHQRKFHESIMNLHKIYKETDKIKNWTRKVKNHDDYDEVMNGIYANYQHLCNITVVLYDFMNKQMKPKYEAKQKVLQSRPLRNYTPSYDNYTRDDLGEMRFSTGQKVDYNSVHRFVKKPIYKKQAIDPKDADLDDDDVDLVKTKAGLNIKQNRIMTIRLHSYYVENEVDVDRISPTFWIDVIQGMHRIAKTAVYESVDYDSVLDLLNKHLIVRNNEVYGTNLRQEKVYRLTLRKEFYLESPVSWTMLRDHIITKSGKATNYDGFATSENQSQDSKSWFSVIKRKFYKERMDTVTGKFGVISTVVVSTTVVVLCFCLFYFISTRLNKFKTAYFPESNVNNETDDDDSNNIIEEARTIRHGDRIDKRTKRDAKARASKTKDVEPIIRKMYKPSKNVRCISGRFGFYDLSEIDLTKFVLHTEGEKLVFMGFDNLYAKIQEMELAQISVLDDEDQIVPTQQPVAWEDDVNEYTITYTRYNNDGTTELVTAIIPSTITKNDFLLKYESVVNDRKVYDVTPQANAYIGHLFDMDGSYVNNVVLLSNALVTTHHSISKDGKMRVQFNCGLFDVTFKRVKDRDLAMAERPSNMTRPVEARLSYRPATVGESVRLHTKCNNRKPNQYVKISLDSSINPSNCYGWEYYCSTYDGDCGGAVISIEDGSVVGFHSHGGVMGKGPNYFQVIDDYVYAMIKSFNRTVYSTQLLSYNGDVTVQRLNAKPLLIYTNKVVEKLEENESDHQNMLGDEGKPYFRSIAKVDRYTSYTSELYKDKHFQLFLQEHQNDSRIRLLKEEVKYRPALLNLKASKKDFLKYGKSIKEVDPRLVDKATTLVIDMLAPYISQCKQRTAEEVYGDVTMNTAAGCLYGGLKQDIFRINQVPENRIIEFIDMCIQYMHSEPHDYIPSVWQNSLKDELRPEEKVMEGKTRTFTAAPMEFVFGAKSFVDDFNEQFYASHLKAGHTVGINKFNSGWKRLYEKICINDQWRKGGGDGKQFDASLFPLLWESVLKIRLYFSNDQFLIPLINIYGEILFTYICLQDGTVVRKYIGNNSGQPSTVVDNSLCLMVMLVMCYLNCTPKEYHNINSLNANFVFVVNGDDNLYTISDEISKYMSSERMASFFESIGVIYIFEDEAKDLAGMEYMSHEFVIYKPLGHYMKYIIPTLKYERSLATISYTTTDRVVPRLASYISAAINSFGHTEFYKEVLILITWFINKHSRAMQLDPEWNGLLNIYPTEHKVRVLMFNEESLVLDENLLRTLFNSSVMSDELLDLFRSHLNYSVLRCQNESMVFQQSLNKGNNKFEVQLELSASNKQFTFEENHINPEAYKTAKELTQKQIALESSRKYKLRSFYRYSKIIDTLMESWTLKKSSWVKDWSQRRADDLEIKEIKLLNFITNTGGFIVNLGKDIKDYILKPKDIKPLNYYCLYVYLSENKDLTFELEDLGEEVTEEFVEHRATEYERGTYKRIGEYDVGVRGPLAIKEPRRKSYSEALQEKVEMGDDGNAPPAAGEGKSALMKRFENVDFKKIKVEQNKNVLGAMDEETALAALDSVCVLAGATGSDKKAQATIDILFFYGDNGCSPKIDKDAIIDIAGSKIKYSEMASRIKDPRRFMRAFANDIYELAKLTGKTFRWGLSRGFIGKKAPYGFEMGDEVTVEPMDNELKLHFAAVKRSSIVASEPMEGIVATKAFVARGRRTLQNIRVERQVGSSVASTPTAGEQFFGTSD